MKKRNSENNISTIELNNMCNGNAICEINWESHYQVSTEHKPGSCYVIADALSRMYEET